MRVLKIVLLGLLALLVVAAIASYFVIRSLGLIPREDYDTQPPAVPAFSKPAVLVFNKVNGFIHKEALPRADALFTQLGADNGWDVFVTGNAAVHNPEDLAKFSLIVWNNTSGDVLTLDQRAALRGWLEAGGGWLGVHAAGGDPSYQWDWYVETLIGAQFVGHTMSPQFQDADLYRADGAPELSAQVPNPWRVAHEEWYAFAANPRDKGYEIILTIDEASYITKGETFFGVDSMAGEHPLAWRHRVGEGRALYTAIGHQAATYDIPEYQAFLSAAMRWTMGVEMGVEE